MIDPSPTETKLKLNIDPNLTQPPRNSNPTPTAQLDPNPTPTGQLHSTPTLKPTPTSTSTRVRWSVEILSQCARPEPGRHIMITF